MAEVLIFLNYSFQKKILNTSQRIFLGSSMDPKVGKVAGRTRHFFLVLPFFAFVTNFSYNLPTPVMLKITKFSKSFTFLFSLSKYVLYVCI